jgi:hypothetical protein
MRSSLHLSDDTNQFGPGTDLMISLVAVLLVLTVITSHLYGREKTRADTADTRYGREKARADGVQERYEREKGQWDARTTEGTFRMSVESFPAGDFYARPVTRLVNPALTGERVRRIVDEYHGQTFPFIFVIGHSNSIDDPSAPDHGRAARLQRNWEYAGRRAALVAALIDPYLGDEERDRLVVMTTGELDQRDPAQPLSQENAWVEVVFGKEWKPPSRTAAAP